MLAKNLSTHQFPTIWRNIRIFIKYKVAKLPNQSRRCPRKITYQSRVRWVNLWCLNFVTTHAYSKCSPMLSLAMFQAMYCCPAIAKLFGRIFAWLVRLTQNVLWSSVANPDISSLWLGIFKWINIILLIFTDSKLINCLKCVKAIWSALWKCLTLSMEKWLFDISKSWWASNGICPIKLVKFNSIRTQCALKEFLITNYLKLELVKRHSAQISSFQSRATRWGALHVWRYLVTKLCLDSAFAAKWRRLNWKLSFSSSRKPRISACRTRFRMEALRSYKTI